ncbi:MAG: Uma2 family endonuclease [Bacteroidota bacterium]|nr:Uma2 family endonuclease [Bacteroidota bacterium]
MSGVKDKFLPNYTYEDYKNWEGKWELIHGIPYAMSPAPRIEHQEVSLNIGFQLKNLLKNCKNCKTLLPIDWKTDNEEDDTVLQPDNLVICKDVKGNFITEAPVMIFEITSPSTVLKDRYTKFNIYETQGVKYYIIADIDLKSADVLELRDKKYYKIIEAKNDSVKFGLDDDCIIDFNFSEIWV